MEEVEVNVQDRILRPVSEVFAAIIDPAKMSGYFISRASGPMKQDATVEWNFDDVRAKLSVDVKRIEENRLIIFDWSASGTKARVTMRLEPRGNNATLVTSTKPVGQWMLLAWNVPSNKRQVGQIFFVA
jgi:uncharacterized protein YndB with AHSA1/START domain